MDNSIFSHFNGQLLVGFSGGADSTALLLMAARGAAKGNYELTAVHFNHHLRGGESDREAVDAEKFADELGVKFLKIDLSIPPGGNLEARARQARLEKWKELCADCENPLVLLGHHLDDNIENFFLRVGRGSNASGLKGMELYSEVDGVKFCRPLLIHTREEIEQFLRENGITSWAVDSSNLTDDYSRNVLRNKLLPEFYRLFPGGKKAVSATLTNISCDAAYLDGTAETAYQTAEDRFSVDFWQNQPRAMTVRMLRMLCRELFDDDSPLASSAVERFEDMMLMKNEGICMFDEKRQLRISQDRIYPCGQTPDKVLWKWQEMPQICWGNWRFTVSEITELPGEISLFCACFDRLSLPDILEIGAPASGEKMVPFGRENPVKIKELRIKRGIPSFPAAPVVRIPGEKVLWLPGVRHSGEYLMHPGEPGVMISAEKIKDFN